MTKGRLLYPLLLATFMFGLAALAYAQGPGGAAIGTAFTYQGHLKKDGQPITDTCAMTFRLYDASSGGTQQGTVGPVSVTVTGGLFMATLDFGATAFGGDRRWLQIDVQCLGDGAATALPRQELTPAPHALFSASTGALQGRPVSTAAPGGGQVLAWNGSAWAPAAGATGYSAGTGLNLAGTTFSITPTYRLPQTCANGQLAQWNNSTKLWECINDATYTAGTGMDLAGSAFSITPTYRLPQTCSDGQLPQWTAASQTWTCVAGSSPAHDHWGQSWTGSGTGLSLSGGTTGVYGTGAAYGLYGVSSSTTGSGVVGAGGATGVYGQGTACGIFAISSSTTGQGVVGAGGPTGVYGYGTAYGLYGGSSPTGVYGTGVDYGLYGSGGPTGVYGTGANYGLYGAGGPIGVYGQGTSTGLSGWGVAIGLYAQSDSLGVYGARAEGGTYGVYGSGTDYGLYGTAARTGVYGTGGPTGVYGTGSAYGLYGIGSSATSSGVVGAGGATGVYGQGGPTGVYGTGGTYGVYGSGTDYGLYGTAASTGVYGANTGTAGYAGYFAGNVNITGQLTKGSGSFQIDHPLAPAEKYLSHSFVESPDMKNVYDGVVVLDQDGAAWVELPAWFGALNRDFRYQLTPIGRSAPDLFIAREIAGNRFQIGGGQPGLKVSWQVTGIRHDAWAEAHRIQVEEDKPGEEQGKYLHPELFGQPESKRIGRPADQQLEAKAR